MLAGCIVGGHTHQRMVRRIGELTIINAGTLHRGQRPCCVVIDLEARRLTVFRENMYRFPAPGQETRNLAYDLYLGLRAGGRGGWLTDVRIEEAGYVEGTHLIRTVQSSEGVTVTTTYFAPHDLPARVLIVVAELRATRAVTDVSVYSIHNFHLGSGPQATTGETKVVRFEAANLHAVNFLLHDILAGGASRSLRSDTQGKTLALALLRMLIEEPDNIDEMKRPTEVQQ